MAHDIRQRADNLIAADVHPNAVCLHHSRLAIAVDDQPWQIVAFSMHQPERVVLTPVGNADALPQAQRCFKPTPPEVAIDGYISERQHPDSDAPYLIVAHSHEVALCIVHLDDVALTNAIVHPLDGSREHPGVVSEQALLLSFL